MSEKFKAQLAKLSELEAKRSADTKAIFQQRSDLAKRFIKCANSVILPVFKQYEKDSKNSPVFVSIRADGIQNPTTPFVILLAGKNKEQVGPRKLGDIFASRWKKDTDAIFFCLEVAGGEILCTWRYQAKARAIESRSKIDEITTDWLEKQLDEFFAKAFPAE